MCQVFRFWAQRLRLVGNSSTYFHNVQGTISLVMVFFMVCFRTTIFSATQERLRKVGQIVFPARYDKES
jgi:hypothetical protein